MNNKVQIVKIYATGLEIKTTAMTTKMNQKQSKSVITDKDKATLTTFIENIKCWKYHKKSHFKKDCSRKKRRKPNI